MRNKRLQSQVTAGRWTLPAVIFICALGWVLTYFLFPGWDLIDFVDNNTRKSIPLEYIKEKSYVIKEGFIPPLDYIKALDLLIKEKTKNDKEIY